MSNILLNISDLNASNTMVALVGISIVFIALTILYLVFRTIPKILDLQARIRMRQKGGSNKSNVTSVEISSEVNAAIASALYLYLGEIHDEENAIMTIKKVSKTYSPWSSKLYQMRWPLR